MKDIKTKGSKKDIRVLDKSADLAAKMKRGLSKSKDTAKNLSDDSKISAQEYAQDNIKYAAEDVTRKTAHASKETVKKSYDGGKRLVREIKQKRRNADSIKQTAKSTGKATTKTVKRNIKTAGESAKKTVKTAERTTRTTIKTAKQAEKTAKQAAKAAKKTAQMAAKAAKKSAEAARATAKAAAKTVKAAVRVTIAAIKASIAAVKGLVAAIAAGGWVAVVIILVITMVALIVGSGFGLFYSGGGHSESGMDMQTAITEINNEYLNKIEEIKSSNEHDVLEMSGSRAVWSDVLAVYSVKIACDPENPQEVATMDSDKLELLKEVFWDMNVIDYRTETLEDTVITETDDGNGNISETEETQERVHLYITVSHKSVEEMASEYGFTDEQNEQLNELLDERNRGLWDQFLYGIRGANGDIVAMALTQIGNIGGEPYWSWYGFSSRVEWCCCFVSWCADRCGYIESGVIPKFAGCAPAVEWFRERNEWQDNTYTPKAGDIIFFDWQENGLTGTADHVGIVEKVENGIITTVEGNTGDSCAERHYAVGHFEIFGYGLPSY